MTDQQFARELEEHLHYLKVVTRKCAYSWPEEQHQDIVQIAALLAWERRSQYRGPNFRNWLYMIVLNTVRTNGRKRVDETPVNEAVGVIDASASMDVRAIDLRRAIRRLPVPQRRIISCYLRGRGGYSIAEKMHLHRAKASLREIMEVPVKAMAAGA